MAAIVKGFLTKKLYQSDKVQHLRKTVKVFCYATMMSLCIYIVQ